MTCQLYRHFGHDDELLYVGVSLSAIARLVAHKRSNWFSEIAKIEIQSCESREEAERLEAQAIKIEGPKYNISMGIAPKKTEFVGKLRRGRPKIASKRPWELESISRRTWYRNHSKIAKPEKPNGKTASQPKPALSTKAISRPDPAQPLPQVEAGQDLPRSTRDVPVTPPGVLKRGRPKITGKRPWELEGISRRTWYRKYGVSAK